MIPAELIKQVRKIQITSSRIVTGAFAGHYQSVFKGKGMEFQEVREYQPGDDIRSIDWNVTARMGHPFIKKFVNERDLTVMLLLDLSPSCHFGTVHQLKRQMAAELCALLAFSAVKNNDRVGLIAFTDRVERFLTPGKGVHQVLRIIRDALYLKAEGRGTDIGLALKYLDRVSIRRTVTLLLSDFYAPDYWKPLSIVSKRHDVVAITLIDPLELNLPNLGLVQLEDAETGESFLIDTSDGRLREEYSQKARDRIEKRTRILGSIPVDHMELRTDVPYVPALIKFFRMREKRYFR